MRKLGGSGDTYDLCPFHDVTEMQPDPMQVAQNNPGAFIIYNLDRHTSEDGVNLTLNDPPIQRGKNVNPVAMNVPERGVKVNPSATVRMFALI